MKKILICLSILMTFISSCIDYEKDIDVSTEDVTYKTAFVNKFGEYSKTQNWDYFDGIFGSNATRSVTQAVCDIEDVKQPDNLKEIQVWTSYLPEKKNNSNVGIGKVNLLSNGEFYCYCVWYCTGNAIKPERNYQIGLLCEDGTEYPLFGAVKSATLGFNPGFAKKINFGTGNKFKFYIKYNVNSDNRYLTSDEYARIIYNDIVDGKQIITLGFEDTPFNKNSDKDFNDIILYLVGNPNLPVPESKRFMCEDLGVIGDFDFNDVVFDLSPVSSNKARITVYCGGGTSEVDIYVNNKRIGEVHDLLNIPVGTMINTGQKYVSKYETEIDMPDNYNFASFNNVHLVVKKNGTSKIVNFPTAGTVPYIVAVPVETKWIYEKANIKKAYPKFFEGNWWNTFNSQYLIDFVE